MCLQFSQGTSFSESGGPDGLVSPSFLKGAVTKRWFWDWGPGNRSQSPSDRVGGNLRPLWEASL